MKAPFRQDSGREILFRLVFAVTDSLCRLLQPIRLRCVYQLRNLRSRTAPQNKSGYISQIDSARIDSYRRPPVRFRIYDSESLSNRLPIQSGRVTLDLRSSDASVWFWVGDGEHPHYCPPPPFADRKSQAKWEALHARGCIECERHGLSTNNSSSHWSSGRSAQSPTRESHE